MVEIPASHLFEDESSKTGGTKPIQDFGSRCHVGAGIVSEVQTGTRLPIGLEAMDTEVLHFDVDLGAWMRALSALPTGPFTEADVRIWLEGPLRKFFPFERFICSYGDLSGGRIQIRSLLSCGYAPDFLASIERTFDLTERGSLAWWVGNRKAFILDATGGFDEAGNPIPTSQQERDEIQRFQLGTVAAHGVVDPFVNTGTYVSFSGVPNAAPGGTLASLNLIAPIVHTLFLATKPMVGSEVGRFGLTDRQRQLVNLALEGLSDKEIASRLSISDNTVGNHLRAIYARLGISRRSQLIAALKMR
ncbi:DNA-binding CsgD family transcriptional regulator [Bradyrhizobium sp. USDA 4503]